MVLAQPLQQRCPHQGAQQVPRGARDSGGQPTTDADRGMMMIGVWCEGGGFLVVW